MMLWALAVIGALAILFFCLLFRQGASPNQWGSAAGQVLFIWGLSNVPVGLMLVESALDPTSKSIFDLVAEEVRLGEIIVYVAAILAPVLYTLISNFVHAAKVYVLTNIAGVVLCVTCASFIYARQIRDVPANVDVLIKITVALYLLSLIFWYFSTVYDLVVTHQDPGRSSKTRATKIEDSLP